jgi:hypothetical protein
MICVVHLSRFVNKNKVILSQVYQIACYSLIDPLGLPIIHQVCVVCIHSGLVWGRQQDVLSVP